MQAAWRVLVRTFSTMCTIAFLVAVADAPLVVAANRDELYARDTRPPQALAAGVVGGLDVQSGGTWMAVHRAGRFAAVTNQRALEPAVPGVCSRGLAVRELAEADDPDAYVAAIDPRRYASMNLVWGDADRVRVAYLRHDGGKQVSELPRGVTVLCNDRIGAPGFPRGERLRAAIERALAEGRAWDRLVPRLHQALSDHTRVPADEVPASHLPAALGRELTATCIHSPDYGTRSASVFALARGEVLGYLHADGPPCSTALVDRSELLRP
jgi:uncharacterized protein with NRDE domain